MASKIKKTGKTFKSFSNEEREAMKSRIRELNTPNGEKAVLAAIAKMPQPYRTMGQQIHNAIKKAVPTLSPKTWYGLPAYANKNGKIVCYFRMNPKPPYNDRYLSFGFNEASNLDDGNMWPISFALTKLTPAEETKIAALVKKAAS